MRNQINRLCPSWLQQHPRLAQPYSRPASFPSPGKSHILKALLPLPSQCVLHLSRSWACSLPVPVGFLLDPLLTPPSFLLLLLSSITFSPIFSWWNLTSPPPLIAVLAVARGGPLKSSQAHLGPASLYLLSKDGKPTLLRTPQHTF